MADVQIIGDIADVGEIANDWDALAVASRSPFSSPAWMTSWWRHAAPQGASLRIIVVREGDTLLGLAPLFSDGSGPSPARYRFLAAPVSARAEPLALPGNEQRVAEAVVATLQDLEPRPGLIEFDSIPIASKWPALLSRGWPGKGTPALRRGLPLASPTIAVEGTTFDDWLKGRRSGFRSEIRRRRRRLEEAGAVFELATTPEQMAAGLRCFASLHYERWQWRGGSGVLDPSIEAMLDSAGRALLDDLRFRVWTISVEGRCISSQIFVGAGGELCYWLGGFDETWAKHAPSKAAIFEAAKHSWEVGDRRIDLGAGGQAYKYGFSDGQEDLDSVMLLAPGARNLLTHLQVLPTSVRWWTRSTLSQRLSTDTKDRLKRVMKRINR